ncbi:nuclear transport factor 2 family protein [Rhodospirillales bacterium]|jgi:steroid Delta-isomerase|nr:nuclear transport factor 2 family protein [Rhodospirillales bacterium]
MTTLCDAYQLYMETLTPASLADLSTYVTEDVRFKDPFNDVQGIENMRAIFAHMFETIGDVKFFVYHAAIDGQVCIMEWRFEGILRDKPWIFDGTTKLIFADDGRVSAHIDYWDAARDFYEHLPGIGWVLERLRNFIAL